jgi:hypothetical protein
VPYYPRRGQSSTSTPGGGKTLRTPQGAWAKPLRVVDRLPEPAPTPARNNDLPESPRGLTRESLDFSPQVECRGRRSCAYLFRTSWAQNVANMTIRYRFPTGFRRLRCTFPRGLRDFSVNLVALPHDPRRDSWRNCTGHDPSSSDSVSTASGNRRGQCSSARGGLGTAAGSPAAQQDSVLPVGGMWSGTVGRSGAASCAPACGCCRTTYAQCGMQGGSGATRDVPHNGCIP